MALFQVAAPQNNLNPVRTLAWNATMRAGDDLKVAFTLLDDDCETPIVVQSARALFSLYPQDRHGRVWDYGMPRFGNDGPYGAPSAAIMGVVQDDGIERTGRINFFLPASATAALCEGRYRAFIAVDNPDGVSTEIEGLIQVRPHARNLLGNAGREYMTIGKDALATALLPPNVINGIPSDKFGFPLALLPTPPIVVLPTDTAVLGRAVLGFMVLRSQTGTTPVSLPVLGVGTVGAMVLGSSGTTPPIDPPVGLPATTSTIGLAITGNAIIGT